MEKNLKVFDFEEKKFRVAMVDGEPWWVVKDIADILGFEDATHAVRGLDTDEKGLQKVETPGGMQDMTVINESGLYALIVRSNKPEAQKFRKWITSEVLPSIRRYGAYMTPQTAKELVTNPDLVIELAMRVKAEEAKRLALEAQAEKDRPKVEFYDAVAESPTAINMQKAAAVLNFKGMGRTNLFKFLREKNILMENNIPYREYIDDNYFRVVETRYQDGNGQPALRMQTLIYQKGLNYIRKKLLDAGYEPVDELGLPRVQLGLTASPA